MRCEQCHTTFCQYRRTAGECIKTTERFDNQTWVFKCPEGPKGPMGFTDTQYDILLQASKKLIESVEKYIQPKKGEFLSRNELLIILRETKKIINESKNKI